MSEPIEAVDLEKKVQEKNISLRPSGITQKRVHKFRNNFRQSPYQQYQPQRRFKPYYQAPYRQFQWRNYQDNKDFRPRYQNRREDRPSPPPREERRQKRSEERERIGHRDPKPNVALKGLGSFITDAKLRELCQSFGPMDMCKLDRDSFGNVKPEGVGLIRYERLEDAKKMVKDLDGVKIVEDQDHQAGGGQISVRLVNAKPRRDEEDDKDRRVSQDQDFDDNRRRPYFNNYRRYQQPYRPFRPFRYQQRDY